MWHPLPFGCNKSFLKCFTVGLHAPGVPELLSLQELIPPLALVLTGSLLLFCVSELKTVHTSFQYSASASASALYSLAAIGVFLITDEHLKGRDNQLPLTCPYPFLSLGNSHLLGLSSQVYFLDLVKGMPSSRSWISVCTILTH